ncbi:MAG: 16S rRNA (guanine(527)-N(7))-methyltransferase RsmG [Candidatus Gracilibacteria bacterium]
MIQKLVTLLTQKSEQLNLFSAGDRLLLMDKHVPDALKILDFWEPSKGENVIDLGTGGGIPGLVLAVSLPEIKFTLVDSREKKIRALAEISDEIGLKNVWFSSERIEDLAHNENFREKFSFVTARAVAELPTLLEYASGFLKVGGKLFAWKSADFEAELKSSLRAQKEFNLFFKEVFLYELPTGERRAILFFEKTAKLSPSYPRKAGTPKAKPI